MVDLRLVSCLDKIFPGEAPERLNFAPEGLMGEDVAVQLAWKSLDAESDRMFLNINIESEISEHIRLFRVRCVPVNYAWIPCDDDNYLKTDLGLYPDLLEPMQTNRVRSFESRWESVWLEINPPASVSEGEYHIRISLADDSGRVLASVDTVYSRIGASLPPQKLIHTRWFHCDGLCSYYGVDMFSEEFWKICESFIRAAVDMSVNCLLTPAHTPPLDTKVGGERLTCQLVDIEKRGDSYLFGFDKLERWVRLAQKCGVKYFEIAHFFTQWGAKRAPKIMAVEDGRLKRVFGWETDAASPEYERFLNQYIPALRGELERLGVIENCFFHISDEPGAEHLESYLAAKNTVKDALSGLKVIDALSNIDFYNKGVVTKPVPASDHIKPFLEAEAPGLWTYYCVGQFKDVSNAFISMPSARTRIIGAQMYKFGIEGFLQWGFNFYNSQYSEYPINPYLTTDGDGFSPSGDCFIVYPGAGGQALPSIRAKVFRHAVNDMRALNLLESLIGKEKTVAIMEEGISPIEFDKYPKQKNYLFEMRRRINNAIKRHMTLG